MRILVGLTMSALMAVAALQAFSPRHTPALAATRLAVEKIHFNTLVQSKTALVAGGELGKLLFSRDQGKDWQPAKLSQDRQALITQVVFASDGLRGLAVGHEGWILRTTDGGQSWAEVAFDEKNGEPLMSAANLQGQRWLAVGSFGRALLSPDDGQTWAPFSLPEGVEDKHMNRIVGSADGKDWLIVGERGLVLRSQDQGESWEQLPEFYNGSFYNALALPHDGWLVYGMRGNAFVNRGDGPWQRAEIAAPASFFGSAVLPDGSILLVGQGSLVATSQDGGAHFTLSRLSGRATLMDIALQPDGSGWLASDAGLMPYSPAATQDAAAPQAGASDVAGAKP
ncbi:WD40/YVTN/BNR-like repeat-containing protein [Alicycliphilus denitrificans]|uniref:WD40/YVTN/BNR-like repeat-containing protein n=1 Tax=Alicycliphilus denitrificans TaxID=179636 RepID=UPI00384B8DF8